MLTNNTKVSMLQSESILAIAGKALWGMALMTIILGMFYPVMMTGLAKCLFPRQSTGSILTVDGKTVGSVIIGQDFSKTPYFQSRPSATVTPYDAAGSTGTNFGASNEKLIQQVRERAKFWQQLTGSAAKVPSDLLTSSSSGLDPHISLAAAHYQVLVVARKTGLTPEELNKLIDAHVENGLFGGPEYVNVLALNLDVQKLHRAKTK